MATVSADTSQGQALYEQTQTFYAHDDAADSKSGGVYDHDPLEFSANEAESWCDFYRYVIALLNNGIASLPIINNTGGTLANGTVCSINGYDATAEAFDLVKADPSDFGLSPVLTLSAELTNGSDTIGYVATDVTGLDTSAGAVGDPVYLSDTAGGWSLSKPTASGDNVQVIGFVTVADALTGTIAFAPQMFGYGTDSIVVPLSSIDIDGGTDIGADLVDADLIIVDDGAGGTNRKSAMSRVWTYISGLITGTGVATAKIDTVAEKTVANGVAVDGLTIKDAGFAIGSDADGDIYYRASGALARLAKGTAGQALKMNVGETAPEWGEFSAAHNDTTSKQGGTTDEYYHLTSAEHTDVQNLGSVAADTPEQGDVLYWDGTDWKRLPHGTSGNFLRTNGDSANPSWATPAGGGDVLGPATNIDGTVPVWNGTNSSTIADSGLLPEEIAFFYGQIYG